MLNIILKNETTNEKIVISDTESLVFLEKEGELPSAKLKINSTYYDTLKSFDICEIYRDNILFFKGKITNISVNEDIMEMEFVTCVPKNDLNFQKDTSSSHDLLEKFKEENPDLFVYLDTCEITKTGDCKRSSFIKAKDPPREISSKILKDTLCIKTDKSKEISELNLEISGSWISKEFGDIDLTNKIAKRFKMGKINTMTPGKLIDSWPRIFDKLPSFMYVKPEDDSKTYESTRQTKYFIGKSQLNKDETNILKFKIDNDIPEISINRTLFNHKLTLSWEYDQFITEIFKAHIFNGFAKRQNKKSIKINLKNIQEYISDPQTKTFFDSVNGLSILNEIFSGIGNYMASSMRNMEVSFEVPVDKDTLKLDCSSWISIKGISVKVSQIDTEFSGGEARMKITCMGFETPLPDVEFIKMPVLKKIPEKRITSRDIIHEITVYNCGDTQYQNLMRYISDLKMKKQISKVNYKRLITQFLNENQTRIRILTKPLKTQHCLKKVLEVQDTINFLG